MTIEEAEDALRPWSRFKFRTLVHNDVKVQPDFPYFPRKAVLVLCPNWEYPDWSERTVSEFLQINKRHRKEDKAKLEQTITISRAEERLKDAIKLQKEAWKLAADDDKGALECLLSDVFFYCQEFKIDARSVINAGEALYRRKKGNSI